MLCVKSLLISAMLVFWACFSTCYAQGPEQPKTVVVSMEKLIMLRDLLNKQEPRINQLNILLNRQKEEFNKQSSQMKLLKQDLTNVQKSLTKSEMIIQAQNKSLMELSETHKAEQRKIKTQRLIWQIVAGVVILQLLK